MYKLIKMYNKSSKITKHIHSNSRATSTQLINVQITCLFNCIAFNNRKNSISEKPGERKRNVDLVLKILQEFKYNNWHLKVQEEANWDLLRKLYDEAKRERKIY